MHIIKIFCRVFLKKDQNRIDLGASDSLDIYINAVREKGKANQAIIDLIAECFLIKKYNITIISGFTTLHKLIAINTSKTKEELLASLR